jgi:hypothetical protein
VVAFSFDVVSKIENDSIDLPTNFVEFVAVVLNGEDNVEVVVIGGSIVEDVVVGILVLIGDFI